MTDLADDFTELVDADIPRVDLVDKAANGTRFLIAKAADGGLTQPLIPREMVADLIAKADHQETPVTDPAPAADTVAKADDDTPVAVDEIIPTAPGGSTAESLPGSPDWEQLDGDTARAAVSTLYRIQQVLGWLSDREAQEAVTGGDYDADGNSWDLDDMACQVSSIIGRLAGFAVGEHLEAGLGDDELEAVGKAVADAAAPLAVVEGLAPIVKAGRTLSAANEAKIRAAVDSLTGVLNSLPQAPAATDDGAAVTKETAPVSETIEAPAAEPSDVLAKALAALPALDAFAVAGALLAGGRTQDVAKAAGDPQLAVFDADGKLIGTIDPAKLSPIATSPAAAADKADEPADEAPADEAPADPAAAPVADDGAAVIPGTDTVQAPAPAAAEDDTKTPAVAKTADPAMLEELRAQVTEDVRKGVEAELAELREQVRKYGQQPDNRRSPRLNGVAADGGAVTRDGVNTDDEVAALRKAAEEATDPAQKIALSNAAFFKSVGDRFTH